MALYVAVQGCIDIALKTISKLALRTPETYADAFKVLSEEKLIPKDLAKSSSPWRVSDTFWHTCTPSSI